MKAVDFFVRWAEDLEDTEQKPSYYPDIAKMDLFKKGYIAKVANPDFFAEVIGGPNIILREIQN